ncbi:hypothetical protein [Wolbachia endosymbiont (group A) of Aleiodes leptofemur]|uniref:hypothetical protein n=1 Tax=Wolbachia endosymbiont (group A) of Aleiodes leptofemur TaxID=3077919 RepID=UPI00333F694F
MLLACYSHKHISYRIRTIIRKAITIAFLSILIHHSLYEKHSKLSLHFFWVRSVSYLDDRGGRCYPDNRHPATC